LPAPLCPRRQNIYDSYKNSVKLSTAIKFLHYFVNPEILIDGSTVSLNFDVS
jgi:hypothetical protein